MHCWSRWSASASRTPCAAATLTLHANTHLHGNDRQGLERLCRYGARGALALERLSRAEDGRIAYRMKRPLPDGTTHLLFTGLELLRRVASLVPAPRANLTRFHGVFAPGSKLRPFLVPQAEETSAGSEAAARKERMKERTPRVHWAEVAGHPVGAARAGPPHSAVAPVPPRSAAPRPGAAARRGRPRCQGSPPATRWRFRLRAFMPELSGERPAAACIHRRFSMNAQSGA
ncbi:MAG TPA: transposase [Myxococcaceae bacterium]|nr:transposase [Myxococcaceae bacterium]